MNNSVPPLPSSDIVATSIKNTGDGHNRLASSLYPLVIAKGAGDASRQALGRRYDSGHLPDSALCPGLLQGDSAHE